LKEAVLLYRATRDGWKRDDFHEKCDLKGPTMTIIKVKETGQICVGFTNYDWGKAIDSSQPLKTLKKAILISMKSGNRYEVSEDIDFTSRSIIGPNFGAHGELVIGFESPMNFERSGGASLSSNEYSKSELRPIGPKGTVSDLTGTFESFIPEEIETFALSIK
jgi:hypothetical protein